MLPPIAALFRISAGLLLRAFFFGQRLSELQNHLLDQLVAKLQTIYPVRVNQSAVERALGTQ